MQVNCSSNTREAEVSPNIADSTLILNSRELKEAEVVDVTVLTPEGLLRIVLIQRSRDSERTLAST
jgi:hypothetical protein